MMRTTYFEQRHGSQYANIRSKSRVKVIDWYAKCVKGLY